MKTPIYCDNCTQKLGKDWLTCVNCGWKIPGATVPSAAEPAPPAPPAPMWTAPAQAETPEQRKEMDRFKRLNRAGSAAFLGGLAAGAGALAAAPAYPILVVLSALAVAPCAIVTLGALYGIKTFRCPRCDKFFANAPETVGTKENGGRCCGYCGFDAYAPGP
jgi:hypothetical protein